MAIDQKGGITRRAFVEGSVAAVATAGVLAAVKPAANAISNRDAAKSDPAPAAGKIAREEHFGFSETLDASYGAAGTPEFQHQLEEIGSKRIAEMDRGGVELCILSLVGPGIQAIPDPAQAIAVARRANDHLRSRFQSIPNV